MQSALKEMKVLDTQILTAAPNFFFFLKLVLFPAGETASSPLTSGLHGVFFWLVSEIVNTSPYLILIELSESNNLTFHVLCCITEGMEPSRASFLSLLLAAFYQTLFPV